MHLVLSPPVLLLWLITLPGSSLSWAFFCPDLPGSPATISPLHEFAVLALRLANLAPVDPRQRGSACAPIDQGLDGSGRPLNHGFDRTVRRCCVPSR